MQRIDTKAIEHEIARLQAALDHAHKYNAALTNGAAPRRGRKPRAQMTSSERRSAAMKASWKARKANEGRKVTKRIK